jgi:hypothetical protein
MMDSDFGNDEFFDGMDRQTARELGLSAGDESTELILYFFIMALNEAKSEIQNWDRSENLW